MHFCFRFQEFMLGNSFLLLRNFLASIQKLFSLFVELICDFNFMFSVEMDFICVVTLFKVDMNQP